ncbi:MAG: AI-2E family transporter [Alphaproteobacteria bacterium]|nr:AI-2E family transporter [Alphaproteobacteria bacterium]
MELGEVVLAPLALALVTGVVLSPFSELLARRSLSPLWGAILCLAATLTLIGGLVLVFQPVVVKLVDQAPKVWADIHNTIEGLRGLLRGISDMSESVAEAVSPEAGTGAAAQPAQEGMALPTVTDALKIAPSIISSVLIYSGGLFFFLLTRSEIYDWVSLHLSARGGRAELSARLKRADRNVSRYFSTITLINAGLGAITAGAMSVLGVADPMILGVVAFTFNFIVYLGPATFTVILLFVGIAQFDDAKSLAPAACFLTLNAIEGQFVTPALVGRHMKVNPLLIFLALIIGLWLWGPIGGIVAIPLLLWILVLTKALNDDDAPATHEPSGS